MPRRVARSGGLKFAGIVIRRIRGCNFVYYIYIFIKKGQSLL